MSHQLVSVGGFAGGVKAVGTGLQAVVADYGTAT